jgi:hypothetical protein
MHIRGESMVLYILHLSDYEESRTTSSIGKVLVKKKSKSRLSGQKNPLLLSNLNINYCIPNSPLTVPILAQ